MTESNGGGYAGKNGVVFGASSLVGRAVGSYLAKQGVDLCLIDLERYGDSNLTGIVQRDGPDATVIHRTVPSGDEGAFNDALGRAADELGGLDYLVCAYYLEKLAESHGAGDLSLDRWDQLLQDWVMNTFLVTRAAFPHMTRGGARVVFFNTTTGYTGEGEGEGEVTVDGSIHKSACSSALTGVMTSIARDIIPKGVSVNGIALGPRFADDIDRIIWGTDFWLSGLCEYACGQILRLY